MIEDYSPTSRSPHSSSSLSQVSPRARMFSLLIISFVIPGFVIVVLKVDSFIFFFASGYKQIGLVIFVCLLPILTRVFWKQKHFINAFRDRYPTKWVRWFIMYPLSISLMSLIIVVAPLGWLISATWIYGHQRQPVPAKIISIEEFKVRKGCDQRVTLSLLSTQKTICLADHYKGGPLEANQEVSVQGKASAFGFLIGNIETL